MRDNQQEPTFEFQDWFDGGDIFYRSKDKQRFQLALNAMIDDDLGLAVIGTNETVLDHYCRMLVARPAGYEYLSSGSFPADQHRQSVKTL